MAARGVRITGAEFSPAAAADPAREAVGLLLLEPGNLSGHVLERRTLPSPGAPALPVGSALWQGDFLTSHDMGESVPGLVWQPRFADFSELTVLPAPGFGVPDWRGMGGGLLTQLGAFTTPDTAGPGLPGERPGTGTRAIGIPLTDADLRIALRIDMPGSGTAGVIFRYVDPGNYYRFTLDRVRQRRVLARFAGGMFRALHVSSLATGQTGFDVEIETVGPRLTIRVDGVLVASVLDHHHASGAIGFQTLRDPRARFADVRVARIPRILGDWRIDDASPRGDRAVWRIAFGVLAKAAGAPPAAGESHAVIQGGGWADLRLAATVQAGAAGGGEFGLVWRYASAQTHTRLALDAAAGSVRLLTRAAGVERVLWSGALAASGGAWRCVVSAIGRRLVLDINGVRLADIADAGLGTGTAGAFAAMGAAMEIGPPEINHAAPVFVPWHRFAGMDNLVSGRRVRVGAASAPGGYAAPAGLTAIWQGAASAGFQPRLPDEGVDLRLRDAAGQVLHQQRFQPAAAFAPLAARLVRAADGTSLLVLPATAGSLPDGEIRLGFTFRRDNTATDPDAPILRQEGESTAERVELFLP